MWGRFLRGRTRGSLGTNHLSASTSEMLCTPNSKAESSRWLGARVEDTDAAQRQKVRRHPHLVQRLRRWAASNRQPRRICIRSAIRSKQKNSQNHNELVV